MSGTHVKYLIIGSGPAGLAAAIRLKEIAAETGSELSVVVLEKGSEVGAHILSGAIDTDKKHSAMNMIQTRGKRVIAEFTLKREVARELLRIDTAQLYRYRQIAAVGALQAGRETHDQQ